MIFDRFVLLCLFLFLARFDGQELCVEPLEPFEEVRELKRMPFVNSVGDRLGWDFTLPPTVNVSDNSFIRFGENRHVNFFAKRMDVAQITWRELEPMLGRYDFDLLRIRIAAAAKDNFGVELHIKGSVWEVLKMHCLTNKESKQQKIFTCNCYASTRCQACEFTGSPDESGSAPLWLVHDMGVNRSIEAAMCDAPHPFSIVNVDIYNGNYHRQYAMLLDQLRQRHFTTMPELAVVYIHAASSSRGEEASHLPTSGPQAEVFRERLQQWASAFGENKRKLTFVGAGGPMVAEAMRMGIGQRSGFIEDYLLGIDNPVLCQKLTHDGYIEVQRLCAPLVDGRAFGDENEEYGVEWKSRYGDVTYFPHRYRESMLRLLQMRRNFVWTSGFTLNEPLLGYVALSMGKNEQTSVDAWVYLRESYVSLIDGRRHYADAPPNETVCGDALPPLAVRNFERWLYQRDVVGGGRTVPTMRVDVPKHYGMRHPHALYDYIARRTDLASQQSYISFAVDDYFAHGLVDDMYVKVTYHDVSSDARCSLRFVDATVDGDGNDRHAYVYREFATAGSGKIRTVTFHLHRIKFIARLHEEVFVFVFDGGNISAEVELKIS